MLLHKGLIAGVQGAIRVTGEGGKGVNQSLFVPVLPLEPPDVTISLKGDLMVAGLLLRCADAWFHGRLLPRVRGGG
jgi:hypothetical protein